jgi:hypothetical protein
VPIRTIEVLADKNPTAFLIAAEDDGYNPFHRACYEENMRVVPVLAKRIPEVLRMRTHGGLTALHMVAGCDIATVEMVELVADGFPQAMTMLSRGGHMPLHLACVNGASARVVQLLVGRGPEAVEILNVNGETVLHCACIGSEPESIRFVFDLWPVAALLLARVLIIRWDTGIRHDTERMMLPHCAASNAVNAVNQDVIDTIADLTKDAACTMIEYSLSTHTSMPAELVGRFLDMLTALNIPGFDATASGPALADTLRPHLDPDLISDLVDNDNVQQLLKKDKRVQNLISGLIRMNRSGRNYVQEEPSNTLRGISVLESISDNVECLFVHLRENALLTQRQEVLHE